MRQFSVRPAAAAGLIATVCIAVIAATVATAGMNVSKGSGGRITRVVARGSSDTISPGATSFVTLPGATAKITVPSGRQALVTARFTAESTCSGGGPASGWCSVRILFGTKPGLPAGGDGFAFDSTDSGNEDYSSQESHSVERFRTLGPGTYTVKVQTSIENGAVTFELDDWTLIVERSIK